MSRSPMDFYHQHIWKFTEPLSQGMKSRWGCTRCGELLDSYSDVTMHCDNQDCENTDEIEWLEVITP